ncbi:MAG TPA: phosphate ABC transporter substrate-binding protein [Ktedonobacteraceae bacterium]|nr:phosphate ABC transporter substrate-binding protein [Ktedonobacteraceae bacterium]
MLKHWRLAFVLALTVMMSVFISACGGSGSGSSGGTTPAATTGASTLGTPGTFTCETGKITASGSTALAPLVKNVAANYQTKCSGASITVNLGGSSTGLSQAEAGSVDIGNSDIYKKAGQDDLVDHQVAVVVFAVIVNSKVTGVKSLTTDQLKSIYSGKTTNWKDVGGPDLKIVVVSRPASSGTRATFQNYVLGGPESISGPQSLTTDSTSTVIQNVAQNDGAIGYAATGPLKGANVTTISIDGNAPTLDVVKNNTYKFWGPEHMYTKGPAKPLAQALIDYMASDYGKQQAQNLGFLQVSDIDPAALQAHPK